MRGYFQSAIMPYVVSLCRTYCVVIRALAARSGFRILADKVNKRFLRLDGLETLAVALDDPSSFYL